VVTTLSRLRAGMWVGVIMNTDPSTSRVVVADDADPKAAAYVNRYVATLDPHPGQAPTSGLSQRVIESGRPLLVPQMPFEEYLSNVTSAGREWFATQPPPPNFEVPMVGVLMVPMRAGGAVIGTLAVFDRSPTQLLTEKDVEWVQAVADRTALALENAQLHSAAIDRLERLTALQGAVYAITASQDLRLTLDVLLEQLLARLRIDAADVLLLDGDGNLFIAASTGFQSTSMPDHRFPVVPELLQRSFPSQRVDTMAELGRRGQSSRRPLFAREGFEAYRSVPFLARNNLLGVLEVFHRSALEPDQEWIGFLDAMAATAAVAIDHAAMSASAVRDGGEHERQARRPAPDFSRGEREVLKLLVEGHTNKQIAATVHRTENTIKFHVRQIRQKIGAGNRTEVARKATQEGWV